MYSIYVLVDPRTSHSRYIGCTSNPKSRLCKHVQSPRRSDGSNGKRVKAWIKELVSEGFRPVMVVIQEVATKEDASGAEAYWIRHFKSLEPSLLNTAMLGPKKRRLPKATTSAERYRRMSLGSKRGHLKQGHTVAIDGVLYNERRW